MVGYTLQNNNGQNIINNANRLSNRNLGYGLNFNGSSNYVQTAFNYEVGLNTPVSYAFSIKILSSITDNDILLNSRTNGEQGINITNRNYGGVRKLDFLLVNSFTSRVGGVVIDEIINYNEIYHIVFTKGNGFTNSNFKGYINGENKSISISSELISTDIVTPQTDLSICNYFNSLYSNCILYDFKIFDKTLTQAEVTQLYKYNNYTTNMIYHLPFNQISGTTTPEKVIGTPALLFGYNSGDKPLRDIQGTVVNEFII